MVLKNVLPCFRENYLVFNDSKTTCWSALKMNANPFDFDGDWRNIDTSINIQYLSRAFSADHA